MAWAINATRHARLAPLYPFFLGRLKRDPLLLVESENHIMNIYFDEDAAKKQSAEEIDKVLHQGYIMQHRNVTKHISGLIDIFTQKMNTLELEECNNSQLYGHFANFFSILERFGEITPRARITGFEKAKEFLLSKGVPEADTERTIIRLTSPNEQSMAILEEIEFLNLANDFLQHGPSEARLEEHCKKWSWLPTDWGSGMPWDVLALQQRISQIQDPLSTLDRIHKNHFDQLKEKMRMQSTYQIQGDIAKIFQWIETEAETRLLRRFAISKLLFNSRRLFFELSRRMNLEEDMAYNLTSKEVGCFLIDNAKPDADILRKRSGYFVLRFDDNGEAWFYDDHGRETMSMVLTNKKQNIINEETIKGTVTFQAATIQAPARIVKSAQDHMKIMEGDIVVAKDTTPDIIAVIKKIKGLITDEGGITCHASILSREFGIPCITGTKYATGALIDGEMVELDTTQGIVKKLRLK